MKKYVCLISLILSVLLCFGSAIAAPVDGLNVDSATGKLLLTGSIEGCAQYRIVVFDKDKSYNEDATYDDAKISEDIIFMTQIPADENGGYSVYVNMADKESGYYTVRVNGSDAVKLYYATETDKRLYLLNVKQICAKDESTAVTELKKHLDLENKESSTIKYFMVADECVMTADSEVIAKGLYEEVKKNPTCLSSAENFVKALEKSAHMAALSDGIKILEEVIPELSVDSDYVEFYNTKFTDKAKKFATELYKNKGMTASQIEESFNENIALSYINNLETWADAKYFVEEFGNDFDIKMSAYKKLSSSEKSDLYDYITDNAPKSTMAAFVKAVNDEIEDLGGSGSGGSGGKGSGGGGLTGGYAPVVPEVKVTYFGDLAGFEWAEESINALFEKGIVAGVGDKKFEPGRNVTREEMITMLIKAWNIKTDGETTNKFADVSEESWYAPYVATAVNNGFVSGTGNGKFGSGMDITRQDASLMAYNVASAKGITFTPTKDMFADDALIAAYAKNAVYALKAKGVISGTGDGEFAPVNKCTRAEAAVIIYKLIK